MLIFINLLCSPGPQPGCIIVKTRGHPESQKAVSQQLQQSRAPSWTHCHRQSLDRNAWLNTHDDASKKALLRMVLTTKYIKTRGHAESTPTVIIYYYKIAEFFDIKSHKKKTKTLNLYLSLYGR